MLELHLSGGGSSGEDVVDGPAAFLFDTDTATDLIGLHPCTFTTQGTISYDSNNLINGHKSLYFPATSSGLWITFPDNFDLSGDITLEWSSYNMSAPSGYAHEIGLLQADNTWGLLARYGDSGFGHLLQFGASMASAAVTYSCQYTKAALNGQLSHHALVVSNGRVRYYRNGVLELTRNGTTGSFTLQSFPSMGTNMATIRTLRFGYSSASVGAIVSRHGRIRISKFARYLGARYTVPSF